MGRMLDIIKESITATSGSLESHPGNVHNAIANASEKNPIWSKFTHSDLPYSFGANLNDLRKHLGLRHEDVLDYTKKYNKASAKSGGPDGSFSVFPKADGNHEIFYDHGG